MQSRCGCSTGENAVVGLFSAAIRYALLQEQALQLPLITSLLDRLQDRSMRNRRDLISSPSERDLVRILHDPALLNSFLQQAEILVLKLEEGDVIRDLVGNGVYVLGLAVGRERRIHLVGRCDCVYVVELGGFFCRQRQTGPHHRLGINRRDEKRALSGRDVVCVGGIWQIATCEVEEVSTLSGELKSEFALNVREGVRT